MEAYVTSYVNEVAQIEKFVRKNVACVQDNKYTKKSSHLCAQLLMGHNYAHLKGGPFSLDKCIFGLTFNVSLCQEYNSNAGLPLTLFIR